jgi:flagellar biosynthesis protein
MMDTPIPNTRKKVVALKYKAGEDDAPRVIAKGQGDIAEKILKLAEEHKIPMYQDADLVEVLSKIDLSHAIPPEMYQAVAEVLAFVYRLNKSFGK